MIHVGAMRVDTELHVMNSLCPSRVPNHLKLWVEVIAYRGHAAKLGPTGHAELRRAALEGVRRLTGVWYSEYVFTPADVWWPVRHDACVLPGEPEYAVNDERR